MGALRPIEFDRRGRESGFSTVAKIGELLVLAVLHAEAAASTISLDELGNVGQRDALTDTPNCTLLLDRMQSAIAMTRHRKCSLELPFIDLDSFKEINDSFGHGVRDEALRLVVRRLTSAVRNSDTFSRYGGGEFLVLLPQIPQPADTALIAHKIVAALADQLRMGGHTFSLSASAGISLFPHDDENAASLISCADTAMHLAKRRQPGAFACYGETIVDTAAPELELTGAPWGLEASRTTHS